MKKYTKNKLENLILVNKIVTIHYFEFDKNFKTDGEKHDFWEIVYADKGEIICSTENGEVTLKENEMIFHKPNEFHSLKANKKTPPNVFIISFTTSSPAMIFFENKKMYLKKELSKYIFTIISEAKKTYDIPYSDPELKKMNLLSNPILGGQQMIKNFLEILLINLMRTAEKEKDSEVFIQNKDINNKIVQDIIELFNINIYEKICVDEIIKELNYSRTHIFKQFRKFTGKSLIEYFTYLKIEKSKELLREKNNSIKEIAEKLSFDTPNYFSKTFKKYTKITPSEYVRRLPK